MTRALYDCTSVPLTPTGPEVRLIIATHAATGSAPAVGTERDGMIYELFGSHLPSPLVYGLGCAQSVPASWIV
jgi:hypothetical protein